MFGPGLLATLGIVFLSLLHGDVLTLISGDQHRKQRKMLNPVFSIAHMRRMSMYNSLLLINLFIDIPSPDIQ